MREKEIQAHLGQTIRYWRLKQGMSQKQLSEELGIHQTAVGKMENASQRIDFGTVLRIAEILEIPWDSLRPTESDRQYKALDGLRELTEAIDAWFSTSMKMRNIVQNVAAIREDLEKVAEGDEELLKAVRDIEEGLKERTPEPSMSEMAWPRIVLGGVEARVETEGLYGTSVP